MNNCIVCNHPLIEHGDYPEESCDCCSGRAYKPELYNIDTPSIVVDSAELKAIWERAQPNLSTITTNHGEPEDQKSGRRDGRIPVKFRVIPGYPEYMINRQGTVKHIETNRFCLFMRLSDSGGALISIRKNGRSKVVAVQELVARTFGGANAKSP